MVMTCLFNHKATIFERPGNVTIPVQGSSFLYQNVQFTDYNLKV